MNGNVRRHGQYKNQKRRKYQPRYHKNARNNGNGGYNNNNGNMVKGGKFNRNQKVKQRK